MPDGIVTFNAGSSSLKFALFESGGSSEPALSLKGEIAGLGTVPVFRAADAAGAALAEGRWSGLAASDRDDFFAELLAFVESERPGIQVVAAGHRVVHGGVEFTHPVEITGPVLDRLERLVPLARLHQPHNLRPIRALARARPGLPQVACFDTSFHRTRPSVATRFALPREYEAAGIRRYGFHGLSYEYVAGALPTVAPDLASGRVIVAHLGNGASLCALQDGKSVDTTMSFTALDGLPMGTRCGAIDPGAVLYLIRERGMSASAVEDLLYHRSGLLGVSGLSSDMRELLASSDRGAVEAIELFTFRIAREIGALAASLGGLDGLVFTAGIGEHAREIRRQVCLRTAWLGVSLDDAANASGGPRISSAESRVAVWVIPTDEEAMIARHTLATARR
jgi:acetate kinase